MREIKRKKERREKIGAQSKGEIGDITMTKTDTAEKKQYRTDSWKLLELLAEKRIENGRTPESAFSPEAAECAKLGPTFLNLESEGDHYAKKKYLLSDLTNTRKETGNREYAGHLAVYREHYDAYQQEWNRRYQ